MASMSDKMGYLAESFRARQEFYREWYSSHTFAETVTGFAKDVAGRVEDALEPAAVAAIAPNLDALDAYVNPVVLSPQMKAYAGVWAGVGSVAGQMAAGFPEFAFGVLTGDIGLRQIAADSYEMVKQGALHLGDYATGRVPAGDPYDMAMASAEKLGMMMMILSGAKALGKGAVGVVEAAAKAAAGSIPPAAALAGVGGVTAGTASVSVDGTALAAAAGEMGSGLIFMSGFQDKMAEMIRDYGISKEVPDFGAARAALLHMSDEVMGSHTHMLIVELDFKQVRRGWKYATARERYYAMKEMDLIGAGKERMELLEKAVEKRFDGKPGWKGSVKKGSLEDTVALFDSLAEIGEARMAETIVIYDGFLRGELDAFLFEEL